VIRRIDPAVWLALLVAVLYLGPEHLAGATDWRQPALEYIAAGLEAGMLWLAAALYWRGTYAVVVCLWAASEAFMRAIFRAMLPLDVPLSIPADQTLGEAVFGLHMGWVSLLIAAVAVAVAAESLRGPEHDASRQSI
jgi:hypothetical protein